MVGARLVLDPTDRVGALDRRLFGTLVEHLGRCVYTGIYEPGHPSADDAGFRGDVAELVTELGPTVVRYPGGNFVSGYRWEDGIGPRHGRPRRLELAWRSIETNEVGLDEFVPWARRTGLEPMVAVNLGTRGIQEACDLVEYANHSGGTYWSDRRRAHGISEPHDVRLWCLGNELDGPWQIGHKTALEYGRLAAETAKAMRLVDPTIELVACGSSGIGMPTFGSWEETVLEHTYKHVDYLSLHAYYEEVDGDLDSFLASAVETDRFIETVIDIADRVGARLGSTRRLRLSFDEWNVWYQSRFPGRAGAPWEIAPTVIEDEYSVVDAVVVGSLLISLLRHADRVAIACLAQLVNVIAPIRTEPGGPAWRQATFHPFAITSRLARGMVLRGALEAPMHETARYGEVATVDATAVWDDASGALVIFAVNRDQGEAVSLAVDLRAFDPLEVAEAWCVSDADIRATNTRDLPERVTPTGAKAELTGSLLTIELPAVSWNAVRLRLPAGGPPTP